MDTEKKFLKGEALWEKAKAFFLMTLTSSDEHGQAERYLAMISSVEQIADKFVLYTSSETAASRIKNDYAQRLQGAFVMAGSQNLKIDVEIDRSATSKPIIPQMTASANASSEKTTNFISTLPLTDEYTFDSFVKGPSNSYAVSAAEGVVKNPGKMLYNPLFIHGGTGLGKTHLMQAIGNQLKKMNPSLAICYLTSETFLNEYVTALQNGKIESFRHRYRSIDLLLIDDIQFMAQKKDCQGEFFNTFNALKDSHKQIVMTSDVAPSKLPMIEERLISRFEGGMVQEIESPSYETRLAILKKKMESSDTVLSNYVLEYIANNIKSHVRAMEGALTRVTIAANAEKGIVFNNETLNHLLKDFIKKEQTMRLLTIEEIQQACAKKFNIKMADILSHEKVQSIVTPRQLAMYICRKLTSKGLSEIATGFGKRHATVLHGVKTIEQRLDNEPELKVTLEEIIGSMGYQLSDIKD